LKAEHSGQRLTLQRGERAGRGGLGDGCQGGLEVGAGLDFREVEIDGRLAARRCYAVETEP
jgi:hypothetical protein